jgi:hypothetical protein
MWRVRNRRKHGWIFGRSQHEQPNSVPIHLIQFGIDVHSAHGFDKIARQLCTHVGHFTQLHGGSMQNSFRRAEALEQSGSQSGTESRNEMKCEQGPAFRGEN